MKLLILRPQPGADATAGRAIAKGIDPVAAPIFTIRPVEWDAPAPDEVEALLLTSGHAARHAGEQLRAFAGLRCYAVGGATAAAARAAGLADVRTGSSDGAAAIALMAGDGVARALHLCGLDHTAPEHPEVALTRQVVYAADAVTQLPAAASASIEAGALVLVHSPRAGSVFASLVDAAGLARERISLAAISEAAAAAAGSGWRNKAVAERPRDDALLELAVKLCQTGGEEMGTSG